VLRPRLLDSLNDSRHRKLTLVSAPAGFGKTTLLTEWCNPQKADIAWLALDPNDNDPTRFLVYIIAALQPIAPKLGQGVMNALRSPQPPSPETVLPTLLNELAAVPTDFVLVLDDYHVIETKAIHHALSFLLEHLPPQMHLVIATREDPDLPMGRLRAQAQLTEVRAAELRFTLAEATRFLNQAMGLDLSANEIAALETRTEGWIAGLQLAALALQGTSSIRARQDTATFIKSFSGSHHFVMDYLVEQVLQQQSEIVQTFLLRTSILDRLCGPLCDAVLAAAPGSGQQMLEYLQHANLFIVPLDNERRWYRYHHLFADLLRQRLQQQQAQGHTLFRQEADVSGLHIRASRWFEENELNIEAFQHAAAANDVERAERLTEGRGIPLHFSGGVAPILAWLESLPVDVLNARPWLWWRHAAMLLINGQTTGVAEKLQNAETALDAMLQGSEPDAKTRNLFGQIASAKATLALTRYDVETMLEQSHRALEFLPPENLFNRATAYWPMGYAYVLLGDRTSARRAFAEGVALSQTSGAVFTAILTTIGLGLVQELDNELYAAAETYRHVLELAGEHPQQIVGEAHLGLARILYEWNDLEGAEEHARQSLRLARQYERIIDRFIISEVFVARLKLARGDVDGAAENLARVSETARQKNFDLRLPEVAAAQVLVLIRQGKLKAAAKLAQAYNLSNCQARVHLAQGNVAAALGVLAAWRQGVEEKGWADERLRVMVLQALALHANGETEASVQQLSEALALAEPGGFVRLFVDEGASMLELLESVAARGMAPEYISKLQAALQKEVQPSSKRTSSSPFLIEPLTQREVEILRLVAQGLSNQEISERLVLSLNTVKGHNRRIFDKLQVQRRTEAVARARELRLI
jgi:LuxR family maltose regulon positive regulatory protein